jgi:hypothetical protein
MSDFMKIQSVVLKLSWVHMNPLPLLLKALLHGQKDRVFFSRHLIYILKRALSPAWDI